MSAKTHGFSWRVEIRGSVRWEADVIKQILMATMLLLPTSVVDDAHTVIPITTSTHPGKESVRSLFSLPDGEVMFLAGNWTSDRILVRERVQSTGDGTTSRRPDRAATGVDRAPKYPLFGGNERGRRYHE